MEDLLYEPSPEASKAYYPLEKCLEAPYTKKAAKAIEKHIRSFPDHIEGYWLQWEYAAHAFAVAQDQVDRYLLKAYDKVLEIIPNAKGQWPKRLPWGWLENRSIHRILLGMGELYWRAGAIHQGTKVFDLILSMDPMDHQGSHLYFLFMLQGHSFEYFMNRLEKDPYGEKMEEYFTKHQQLHWSHFTPWLKERKEMMK